MEHGYVATGVALKLSEKQRTLLNCRRSLEPSQINHHHYSGVLPYPGHPGTIEIELKLSSFQRSVCMHLYLAGNCLLMYVTCSGIKCYIHCMGSDRVSCTLYQVFALALRMCCVDHYVHLMLYCPFCSSRHLRFLCHNWPVLQRTWKQYCNAEGSVHYVCIELDTLIYTYICVLTTILL